MNALEQGEVFVITRRGVDVGELRPIPAGAFVNTLGVKRALKRLPQVDFAAMREEADALLGSDFVGE